MATPQTQSQLPRTGADPVGPHSDSRSAVAALEADWQAERPDLSMDSVRVFVPLRGSLQRAEESRAAILARYGLTPAMFDLVVALRRSGRPYVLTPSDLTRALVLSAGGVSQRLEKLEQAGLIERNVNTNDRRVIYVSLTEKGVKLLDSLMVEYMANEESLLGALRPAERAQLARLLPKLEASIVAAHHIQPGS